MVTSCIRRLLTWRRASTRCWSSDESPPGWRVVSADCGGTSEVGVEWVEGGLFGAVVTVMVGVGGYDEVEVWNRLGVVEAPG